MGERLKRKGRRGMGRGRGTTGKKWGGGGRLVVSISPHYSLGDSNSGRMEMGIQWLGSQYSLTFHILSPHRGAKHGYTYIKHNFVFTQIPGILLQPVSLNFSFNIVLEWPPRRGG
jgi:hypothetical protein